MLDLEALQRDIDALAPAPTAHVADDIDFEDDAPAPAPIKANRSLTWRHVAAGLMLAATIAALSRIGGCMNDLTDPTKPLSPTRLVATEVHP